MDPFFTKIFFLYTLLWATFGLGHSVLAGPRAKAWFSPLLGAGYRLAYNLFAGAHFTAIWFLGLALYDGGQPLSLPDPLRPAMMGILAVGVIVAAMALREYNLGAFAGTEQIRRGRRGLDPDASEPLATGGLHAFIRHPLYAGVLLAMWGRVRTDFDLASAVLVTLYLGVGMWSEEKKLVDLYGPAYTQYQRRVPAIIPWKGRAL